MLVGVVNLGVTLAFRNQKTNLFETLELSLNVTGVFLNKLRKSAYVRLEIGVLCVHHYNLAPNS